MNKRIFKLRAWDGAFQAMFSLRDLLQNGLLDIAINNNTLDGPALGIVLMEWTGFKDCDNRDIYEGDILAVITEEGGFDEWWTVEWNEGHGGYYVLHEDDGSSGYLPLWEIDNRKLTIVGNVFQNSELLSNNQ